MSKIEVDAPDIEAITKAAQVTQLLQQDIKELVRSRNPLLSSVAADELQSINRLANRLDLLKTLLSPEEAPSQESA